MAAAIARGTFDIGSAVAVSRTSGLRVQKICAECEQEATEAPPDIEADTSSEAEPVETPAPVQSHPTEALSDANITIPEEGPSDFAAPDRTEAEATVTEESPSELIVSDTAESVQPGQMRREEFLIEVRQSVEAAVDDALAGTGRSTRDCPYIEYWFRFYSRQDSGHIERTVRRYAREAAHAESATELIAIVRERARRAAEIWAETGQITGVPEGVLFVSLQAPASRLVRPVSSMLLRKAAGGRSAPEHDPESIRARLGAGRPLDGPVRAQMEAAFGRSFSHVRVHGDSAGAALSSSLAARAFTVGSHIAFGAGEYRPGTLQGDVLIAHELAHVVQQIGTPAAGPDSALESQQLEEDANIGAMGAVTSLWRARHNQSRQSIWSGLTSGLRISRCRRDTPPPPAACVPAFRSLTATGGTVGMTTAWPGGHCELALGTPGAVGMAFRSQVDVPTGCTGTLQYVQLINRCIQKRDTAGTNERINTGGNVLDTSDPYPSGSKPVSSPGTVTFETSDSPSAGFAAGNVFLSGDDKFKMWLLWRPSAPAGAPRVALAMVAWDWKAKANKTGATGGCAPDWTVSDTAVHGGTGAATGTLPTWTKTYPTDFSYGAGTC